MIRTFFASLASLSAATAAWAQPAAPTPGLGSSLWQLALGLAIVLALVVASLWLLKALTVGRRDASGLLRVVSGTAVGARERVVVVEVGTTWLVLGVAPGRVSALAEIPRQATEVAPPGASAPATAFPEWMRTLTPRR